MRKRWHNLKYYTWVEQQGKTVEELNAQRDPAFWEREQAQVAEVDRLLLEYRAAAGGSGAPLTLPSPGGRGCWLPSPGGGRAGDEGESLLYRISSNRNSPVAVS